MISYNHINELINNIPDNTQFKFLLMFYMKVYPLRTSDFADIKVVYDLPKQDESQCIYIDNNENGKNAILYFNVYKTTKTFNVQQISIPQELIAMIENIINGRKSNYLFVDISGKPFNDKVKFNKWVNAELKNLTKDKSFTFSNLREIILSNKSESMCDIAKLIDDNNSNIAIEKYLSSGNLRCQAITKKNATQCTKSAKQGYNYCGIHID